MQEIKLTDSFGNELHTYIFNNVKKPKGVIQISHGINEHGLRYKEFAEFMNKNDLVVYIEDHVSQGLSRREDEEDVVYFGENGKEVLVDGLITVKNKIKEDYPDLAVYIVAHSLGTSIVRKYIQNHGCDYEKVILNGGGYTPNKGMGLIIFIGNIIKLFGKLKPSNFFDKSFRRIQYSLKEKVEIDHFIEWLTRDKELNERDKEDQFLYIRLSISAYVDMLKLFKEVNTQSNIKKAKHDTKILLMSGTHDAATDFGKAVIRLHNLYTQFGYTSLYRLYKEGRHDSFKETNRKEIYQDIVDFIRG